MDRQELRRILIELLEETTGEKYAETDDNQSLQEGLGLDSVDVFSLVVELQTNLKIKISSDDLGSLTTVGDLLDLLQARLPDRSASNAA
jgi:acyl carrier protein